jgi:hypothetical protein
MIDTGGLIICFGLDFVLFDYFITCVLFHLDKASEKDNRL